jgi:exosome complex component RRP40
MAETHFVLPGDVISPSLIPTHKTKPLRLGPGLQHIPPAEIVPTVAGLLTADRRKNSVWVEYAGGRYTPSASDLVIGQIHHTSAETYHVSLTPHGPLATLPQMSFEGATKKTRPQLVAGQLVYARVTVANKHMDAELECVSASSGKSDGLGPLVGGMVIEVSLGFARRLLMAPTDAIGQGKGQVVGSNKSGVVVLEELGAAGLAFETAVGRNGKVWVNSENVATVVAVCRALRETDEKGLDVAAQKKFVQKLGKGG